MRLRDPGLARHDGCAVALRVPGDATDGHVDAVSRGGALLFGLAPPEAVLTVLSCPFAAGDHDLAPQADGTGPGLAEQSGLGTLTRRCEEQVGLPDALGVVVQASGPVKIKFETVSVATVALRGMSGGWGADCGDAVSGSRWGVPAPRSDLRRQWCRIHVNLSNS